MVTTSEKRREAWREKISEIYSERTLFIVKQQEGLLTRQDALILGRLNRELAYYERKLNKPAPTHLSVQTQNRRRIARELSVYAREIRKITGRFPDGYRKVKA